MKGEATRICRLLALLLLGAATGGASAAGNPPDLLVYIGPQEYSHEVHVGYKGYFSAWVRRGPLLEKAAREKLKPYFGEIGLCDGRTATDLIVWLKPTLTYNPVSGYYAKVSAQFHLGDGKRLGSLKATGRRDSSLGSSYVEEYVQQAFDSAMQDIGRQYAADSNLQAAIRSGLAKDITKAPCTLMTMIPNP